MFVIGTFLIRKWDKLWGGLGSVYMQLIKQGFYARGFKPVNNILKWESDKRGMANNIKRPIYENPFPHLIFLNTQ